MFRKDINGLRAIAVIAVVIFHFKPTWVEGGFAGVDVFFVISGFLMTGIIFRGLELNNFSLLQFYVSRANRIIPALALLCSVLLLLGMLILTPNEYKVLGMHAAGSLGFFSNILYWTESGYFDSASHGKWLLHTWSLSAEWQFYIIYPLVLFLLHKFISIKYLKLLLLLGTITSFLFCIFFTYNWPTGAYFLLPSRIWEMLLGGVAYLYPITLKNRSNKILERIGIVLILSSYFFISQSASWPGYLAFLPVFGTYLIIQSKNENSLFTGNYIFQKIGAWSYSIYLWHWPIVVFIYYYSLPEYWIIIGITLSVFLGYLSYRFIENIKFKSIFNYKNVAYKCVPLLMIYFIGGISYYVYYTDGDKAISSDKLLHITQKITPSPYRKKCHTGGENYTVPNNACIYFDDNVTWAIFGDSHTVELSYVLAGELNKIGQGIKHFSFSACKPNFKRDKEVSNCAKWTNDVVNNILSDERIENIVIGYRYSAYLFGDQLASYPNLPKINNKDDLQRNNMIESLSLLIETMSQKNKNIYIIKPIPELGKSINKLVKEHYRQNRDVNNIIGTTKDYYLKRNEFILNYFNNTKYRNNIKFIDPVKFNCDDKFCWAVKQGIPLYFDDNHLSLSGALPLAKEITSHLKNK